MRSIAKLAGVTEATLYRHFENKDDLYLQLFSSIVEEMIAEKRVLMTIEATARAKLKEWVRLSYAFFDRDPDAFVYVFLTDHRQTRAGQPVETENSRMFIELLRGWRESGEMRDIEPLLAMALFSGILLNIPRLIHAKVIEGPAMQYTDLVADAGWRLMEKREA